MTDWSKRNQSIVSFVDEAVSAVVELEQVILKLNFKRQYISVRLTLRKPKLIQN